MAELFANNTISGSYADHMRKEHDGSKWGSTGYRYSGKAIEAIIDSRPYLKTALDYGCGKGTVAIMFARLDWREYDPGIPGKQELPRGQYDFVTCTDVMEHVESEFIDNVIDELVAKTEKVLFVDIACYPTGKVFGEGPYKGQDMHISVHEPEWWLDAFNDRELHLAESYIISKYSKGRYKPRIQLTYERI